MKKLALRLLLVVVLGPVPAALFVALCRHEGFQVDHAGVYAAGLFAFWGLTAGVWKGELSRALIGLNGGAGIGFLWGNFMAQARFESNELPYAVCAAVLLAGAALGAALNFYPERPFAGLIRGGLSGAFAFGVMAGLAWLLGGYFSSDDWYGLALVCGVPFSVGMALFLALVARRETTHADSKRENVSTSVPVH